MQSEKPSYYSIIPAAIRYDNSLKANEKLLYGEITSLANATGACWATNAYFAKLYGVSTRTITDWVNDLVNKKYLFRKDLKSKKTNEEKRVLYIAPLKKTSRGYEENFYTPLEENFQENNTSINNKNNRSSSKDAQNSENAYEKYGSLGLTMSATQRAVFNDYFEQLGNDLICNAIEYMDNHATHKNFSYLQQILLAYDQANIKTVDQAKQLEEKRKNKASSNGKNKQRYNYFAGEDDPDGYDEQW